MKLKSNVTPILIIWLLMAGQALMARNIEYYYINMPEGLNPTLTRQNKLELLEYAKAKQTDSVANRFGKPTRLLYVDTVSQCVKVQNTPVSVFEMKLFKTMGGDTIIGVIHTVCTPVCHSNVEFYNTDWAPVPLRFAGPKAVRWLDRKKLQEVNTDPVWVENVLATGFISLTFSRNEDAIEARNNTLLFLSDKDRKEIEPLMSDKLLIFRLKGKEWVEVN